MSQLVTSIQGISTIKRNIKLDVIVHKWNLPEECIYCKVKIRMQQHQNLQNEKYLVVKRFLHTFPFIPKLKLDIIFAMK